MASQTMVLAFFKAGMYPQCYYLFGVVEKLQVSPLVILVAMQLIVFVMGTFMETISIMMICMPIVKLLGFDAHQI
jgi:TRAP-type C4-dicarboxylate transport system permease large subunit